jgi:hypothetical protein
VGEKRRLPVVQDSPPPATPVAPWKWSVFCVGLSFLFWAAFAMLAAPLSTFLLRRQVGRWSTPEDLGALLGAATEETLRVVALENLAVQVASLALASFLAGFIVGKWGPDAAVALSGVAGVLVGVLALAVALAGGVAGAGEGHVMLVAASLVIIPCAAGAAALGARQGRQRRVEVPLG